MRKYFVSSDDFFYIINSVEKGVKSIRLISTGWTNFVFDVKAEDGEHIFRFPRNDFFSDVIIKECQFLQNVERGRLSFHLPDLKLSYFAGRPFSCHKKLAGRPLKECALSEKEMEVVAQDVCKFLKEFQSINLPFPLSPCSQFLEELSKVPGDYDLTVHGPMIELEKEKLVPCHGDFNPGNILIENGRITSVIDFAFVSLSTPLNDIARLIGRSDKKYEKILLNEYQNSFGKCDLKRVEALSKVWEYVDKKYISYIKSCHPEIELKEN